MSVLKCSESAMEMKRTKPFSFDLLPTHVPVSLQDTSRSSWWLDPPPLSALAYSNTYCYRRKTSSFLDALVLSDSNEFIKCFNLLPTHPTYKFLCLSTVYSYVMCHVKFVCLSYIVKMFK